MTTEWDRKIIFTCCCLVSEKALWNHFHTIELKWISLSGATVSLPCIFAIPNYEEVIFLIVFCLLEEAHSYLYLSHRHLFRNWICIKYWQIRTQCLFSCHSISLLVADLNFQWISVILSFNACCHVLAGLSIWQCIPYTVDLY